MESPLAALPASMRFSSGLKDVPTPLRFTMREFLAEGGAGGFAPGATIRIPISAQDSFCDTRRSYLRVGITVTGNATAAANRTYYLAPSVYSCFRSMRIIGPGGAVVEDCQAWGDVCNLLLNGKMPRDMRSAYSTRLGISETPSIVAAPGTAQVNQNTELELLAAGQFSVAAGASVTKVFTPPIIGSGIMSLSSSSHNGAYVGSGMHLPLALMGGPLTLELTLHNDVRRMLRAVAIVGGNAAETPNISFDVRYAACLVQPDASVIQAMKAALSQSAQKLYVSSHRYNVQTFTQAVNNGVTATANLNLNERARSIKSIMVTNRPQAILSDLRHNKDAFQWLSTREFYMLIGSNVFPQQRVSQASEFLANADAALGGLAGTISQSTWAPAAAADITTFADAGASPSFFIGYDLETLPADAQYAEVGYNNAKTSSPITLSWQYTPDADGVRQYDVITHVDQVLVLDPVTGTLESSY